MMICGRVMRWFCDNFIFVSCLDCVLRGASVTVANAVKPRKSTYNPGSPAEAQIPVVTAPRRMRGAERPMGRGPSTSLLDACVELDALVVRRPAFSPTKKG